MDVVFLKTFKWKYPLKDGREWGASLQPPGDYDPEAVRDRGLDSVYFISEIEAILGGLKEFHRWVIPGSSVLVHRGPDHAPIGEVLYAPIGAKYVAVLDVLWKTWQETYTQLERLEQNWKKLIEEI